MYLGTYATHSLAHPPQVAIHSGQNLVEAVVDSQECLLVCLSEQVEALDDKDERRVLEFGHRQCLVQVLETL